MEGIMLPGVYIAYKKNGTAYYRASITYRNKHISLGSFHTEEDANLEIGRASCRERVYTPV